MKIFHKIIIFILKLQGLSPCSTVKDLCDYVKVGDIDHLAFWIYQTIWYIKDKGPEDEWKSAERTLKEKKGDCEDVAILAKSVIATWPNWKCAILVIYNDSKAHAVCTFERPDGKKGLIDGKPYLYDKNITWDVIIGEVFPWAKRSFWK